MDDNISVKQLIRVLFAQWKPILAIFIIATATAYIFSVRQKPLYQASAKILMRSGGGASSSTLSMFADLAGIKMGGGDGSSDLLELMKSRAVADKVVRDLKLRSRIKGWDDPKIEDHKLAAAVSGMLREPKAEGNMVALTIRYTDPDLCAEVANAYSVALAYYWNEMNLSAAQKKRQYIESQLPRVKADLTKIEEQIKAFTLLGLEQKPSVELERLKREFKVQDSVYTMLRSEYEAVKLDESKEFPPFSVVDIALVPEIPVKPNVKVDTMLGAVFGLMIGIFMANFIDYWKNN